MAPSPSYLPTAFPKSVHSRATHDGEGAVATANPQMQSKIGNRKFPTINYQLSTTNYHLHLSTSTRLRPFPTTARAPSPRTVGRNKCDPPVSILGRSGLRPSRGDGALAIVSANRLPEISQFPRNARRRGRRRYGTIHYPTTNYQLNRKIVNSQLPTTHYQLPTIIYISTLLHGHSLNH